MYFCYANPCRKLAFLQKPVASEVSLRPLRSVLEWLPGVALCAVVTALALELQDIEERVVGRPYLEAIVLAILIGIVVRTLWSPGPRWTRGIDFSAKTLLEIAVALLGASISVEAVLRGGAPLVLGIVGVVTASLAASYVVGRGFRLPHRLAILVACGNSICGNSAIAAVAPIIGADQDEITSSIAFTAVLGIVVVLLLPPLAELLKLTPRESGVFAGLTVYAVPQVLAATSPLGLLSTQIGTMVKLMRVLMLGPVMLLIALSMNRSRRNAATNTDRRQRDLPLARLLPWFIVGFAILMGARSLGWIPSRAIGPIDQAVSFLTIIAMAALGLGVDLKSLCRIGGRTTLAASVAVLILGCLSLGLIHLLPSV
jgi:uncharacterized integral membrane protein (TIGR00698 family)